MTKTHTHISTTNLPIIEFLPQIKQALSQGNVVLEAEPGAGKSTALVLSLLNAPWLKGKKIIMLEPRRVAAKSIAHYLSQQLGEPVGHKIGYHIKNDRKVSKQTLLEIVTEGILTRRLQADAEMADIGLIIFDEFHERSIHSDLSLLITLEVQQTIREDLAILVMSATIDTQMISNYLAGATVIQCPGRQFPVSVEYAGISKEPLDKQIGQLLSRELNNHTSGDVIVFLPGQSDIHKCIKYSQTQLKHDPNLLLLPLYAALPIARQEQALSPDPNGKQRIIFTTNIAETSLTIEGVTLVIDSGLEKVMAYDPTSAMSRLETQHISKASAKQRKGRAGRTQPGTCIRLWDKAKQSSLPEFQTQAILTSDLTGLVLDLSIWGADNYDTIHWLNPPPRSHFLSALHTLKLLELVDSTHKVTALGLKTATTGLSPRLSSMLLRAHGAQEKEIACELAALLSGRDIFSHTKSVDIVERLLAIHDYKKNPQDALRRYPINRSQIDLLLNDARILKKSISQTHQNNMPQNNNSNSLTVAQLAYISAKLLIIAYPDRLAQKRENDPSRYLLANGKGAFLFDHDSLLGQDWLIISDCDAQKKEGRIYMAVSIEDSIIKKYLSTHFTTKTHYLYNQEKQKIIGRCITQYYAIIIKTQTLSTIPKEDFHACLTALFSTHGMAVFEWNIFNWDQHCKNWLVRAQWLADHLPSFIKLSDSYLLSTIQDWLFVYLSNVSSMNSLKKVNLLRALQDILSWDEKNTLEKEAPTHYIAPSKKLFPIHYGSQQGPTVSVKLQEIFGELNSPTVAAGNVTIRFELLSPALRPIQTTSDLANFWRTSYIDIAKEMRGRYPKHRWPEKPLLEKAGKSIKNKKHP